MFVLLGYDPSASITQILRHLFIILFNSYNAEICLCKEWRRKGFSIEIIINVLFSSFCFISVPMLWVYGYYKYFTRSVRESTLDAYK